ncbi:MAG TPA: hypothetical protein VM345_17575 [Acidimicrobiales bacterium]|jgi:hypothetical protein|nr:hypothetical protein [Acidimicrobiales bacterium]
MRRPGTPDNVDRRDLLLFAAVVVGTLLLFGYLVVDLVQMM